jgi:hypothetical protein
MSRNTIFIIIAHVYSFRMLSQAGLAITSGIYIDSVLVNYFLFIVHSSIVPFDAVYSS